MVSAVTERQVGAGVGAPHVELVRIAELSLVRLAES